MKNAALLALALLAAACSSESSPVAAPPSTTSTTAAEQPITISWTDDFESPLPNGWSLRGCEGQRPSVCAYDGTTLLGDIDLLSGYPLGPEDADLDDEEVAVAWGRRMVDVFRDDRAAACPGFAFEPIEVERVTVGGMRGARGGFVVRDSQGQPVERVLNHYVVVDGAMTIINADAYASDGGCLPPSEVDLAFAPSHLEEIERVLDHVVATAPVTGRIQ